MVFSNRIVNLILINFLALNTITLFATEVSSQKLHQISISVDYRSEDLLDVLSDIEHKSKFNFDYEKKTVRARKGFTFSDAEVDLESLLEEVALQYGLKFRRYGSSILVLKDFRRLQRSNVVEQAVREISGIVTDPDGVPLPGASVLEKGTSNGTNTDFDGKFNITVDDNSTTLVISYVGFESTEVDISGADYYQIVLQPSASELDEVVVVGYGVQKKSDVTGSIGSVKEEDFNRGVVANPGQLLQGKVAGLNITATSGEPGAQQDIIIRGVGSLRSGTTPLFVVDGFVIDNSSTGVSSNPLNFINPQDIASIDVLKDASATAIYGARAANGVIVITTKRGEAGKSEMNISVSTAFSSIANTFDVFGADEFRRQVQAVGGTLFDAGAETDWQDELTRTGFSKNLNFSMSGGTADKFNYYLSTGMDDQEGILENSSLKRYSGRVNLSQTALDGRFKVDFQLTAARTINERPDIEGNVVDMIQLNPTIPVYTNGEPTLLDERLNPITRNEIFTDEATNTRILANIAPSLEILKGLVYRMNLGVDYSVTNRYQQRNPFALLEGLENGFLNKFNTSNTNFLVENTLTYTIANDRHNLTLLAGHSYQETVFEDTAFSMEGFADNDIEPRYQDQISTAVFPTTHNATAFKTELQSFFGRMNYSLDNKYLLTATMRADGSSKFGENNKYGYFPSFALGWNLGREDFLAESEVFTNLKLRASWGQTGNQDGIPSNVSLASFVDSRSNNDTYPLDGTEVTLDDYPFGSVPVRTANPDLQWEVSTQTNIGLDFGLFGNRVTGTVDYFYKVASDVVLFANRIDPIQPTEKFWTNIEDLEIQNKGVELSLDYISDPSSDFTYNFGGNVSFIDNKVVNSPFEVITTGAASGAGQTGATINGYINNEPVGAFYMKEFIGIGDDGLNQFRDVVPDGQSLDNDRIVAGSALPDLLYAFYMNFRYKALSLSLNFNGVAGNKIYNHTAMSLFTRGQLSQNQNTTDLTIQFPNESNSNSNEVSTRYLEDGDFLRLNNATLGYTLDARTIGLGEYIQNVQFTLTGQNLFVITDYSGFDPEVNSRRTIDGIQSFGIDRFSFPNPRTILFGLNVSFK